MCLIEFKLWKSKSKSVFAVINRLFGMISVYLYAYTNNIGVVIRSGTYRFNFARAEFNGIIVSHFKMLTNVIHGFVPQDIIDSIIALFLKTNKLFTMERLPDTIQVIDSIEPLPVLEALQRAFSARRFRSYRSKA